MPSRQGAHAATADELAVLIGWPSQSRKARTYDAEPSLLKTADVQEEECA
jgi:hypothetical protein